MITDDDVRAYLDRLQVEPEPASADALIRLHRAQVEHVPYETTWIHMDERWGVERVDSFRRIAHLGRGGYCFHVNGAFSLLLEELGYRVSLHVGGVHGPDGPATELMENHLVLLVHDLPTGANPGGTWYVDAGLGDALHEPLPLVAGRYRQDPFDFVLSADGTDPGAASIGDWRFHHDPRASFTGMAFRSTPASIDDFAARNAQLSTAPDSGFVKVVTAQRRDATGVDVLRGQMLRRVDGTTGGERVLATQREWFEALADVFSLRPRDVSTDQADHLWRRVHAAHQAWMAGKR